MEILITGGAGFIGSHLAERHLADGHHVTCLDNFSTGTRENLAWLARYPRLAIIEGDVCDPIDRALPRFHEIYNLACPASPPQYQADGVATMRACSDGVLNVLNRALSDGARLFHASTSEIYGDPLSHPQREGDTGNVHTIGPRACYDEGKRFAEALIHTYAKQHGANAVMARIFNTYGPRMQVDDGRLISNVVVQALTGETVTIYGDGSQTRSLCYVDDTVEAIIRLTRSPVTATTPVNVGNPDEQSVMDIISAVLVATGTMSPVDCRPLPQHDPMRRRPDIRRARDLLGWNPEVPFADGLSRTIAYFRSELGLQAIRANAAS